MQRERHGRDNRLHDWLVHHLGELAVWLRGRWVLPGVTFVATLALGVAPWILRVTGGVLPIWLIVVAISLAVASSAAVLLDRLADSKDADDADRIEASLEGRADEVLIAAEAASRNAVSELNTVLESAHEVAFLEGASRSVQIRALRRDVVKAAAHAVGPGSRATYYILSGTPPERRLEEPVHAVGYGRDDKPDRPFIERESPDLTLWPALNRSDTECRLMCRDVDDLPGMDWSRKSYSAFVNVPVRARGLPFGMLSVNVIDPAAIGETERAVLIAMARVLASTEAMALGPRSASDQESRLSGVPDTLAGLEILERQEQREGDNG